MRGRSVGFIILNVLISAGVALGILQLLPSDGDSGGAVQIATVRYVVTQTPDPDADATRIAQAVAGTVQAQSAAQQTAEPQVDLPPDIQTEVGTSATTDPVILTDNPAAQGTAGAVPDGCVVHVIAEGDTPFGVAEEYGVDGFTLLEVNNLTEETAFTLQIGDTLVVPLPSCPIEELAPVATATSEPTETVTDEPTAATDEARDADSSDSSAASDDDESDDDEADTATPTPTPTPTRTPTPTPTLVVEPTAANAQLEIVEILSPGDITAEGVRILNRGNVVDITGWTLSDAEGNEFVFPEQRLFTNGGIIVYTRDGESTPVVKYWGRSTAVWGQSNEVATLRDAAGQVQSSVRVNAVENE